MKFSISMKDWNAACLNAVHCAISSTDALLVYHASVRSAGESHFDVLALLTQHVKDAQTSQKAQTLRKIMDYKNAAAYEDKELTEQEAKDVEKLTERFFEWAQSKLK
ncbi:MAG: HEPN domain-containing protein [Elusimicrobia bacterium]|nr:HEPN domain-containing protein [Elusimicrobiota bacterium]